MNDSSFAFELRGVTKQFGFHTALDDIDFKLPRGAVCGLLGPNGSGKTTCIRLIMEILVPDLGWVQLFGRDADGILRRRVGYLPEERGLYPRMKTIEVLVFLAQLRGVSRSEARRRASAWLDRLELGQWRHSKVEDLSKGMQQKLQFIATVLHEPELLILDEPFSGLDPLNQQTLEEIIREFQQRGTTIVLSTHLMEQAERLCDRVCMLSRGRKVADAKLKELWAAQPTGMVEVEFRGPDQWLDGPEVERIENNGDVARLHLRPGANHEPILRRGIESGARIANFGLVKPRLKEIFLRYAGAAAAEGGDMDRGGIP